MVNFILNLIIIGIFRTTKIFQAGNYPLTKCLCGYEETRRRNDMGKCRKLFEAGDKFKFWSREDFLCFQFGCSDENCKDGMLANVEYGCNNFWFKRGTSLGEGGFGKVFQFPFHGIEAAFKEIPIYFGNDRDQAIEQAYDEYNIMNTVSKRPITGGKMVERTGGYQWVGFII